MQQGEKSMDSKTKELLINLKEKVYNSRREEERRFIKIWLTLSISTILFQVIIFGLLGVYKRMRIVPLISGYILGFFTVILIVYFIKRKKGSITGIDYFKEYKESLLLDKELDIMSNSFDLKYTLIDLGYLDFKDAYDCDKFLDFLSSKKYQEFKSRLIIDNYEGFSMLNDKEEAFKEKMKEISIIREIEEKDLNNI